MPESLAATKSAAASTSGSQQSQACSAAAATSVAASSTTPSAAASATAAPKVSQPQSAAMATAQPTATTHAQKPVATINGTAITTNNNINGSTNSAIPPQQPPRKSAESPKRNTCPNSTTCSWNFANSNDNSSALPSTLRPTPTTTTIQKLPRLPGRRNGGKSFMGILHFEDTIRQITEGCVLEEQERKKEREQHQQQLLDEKTAAGNDTQQPDDNKSQSLPTDQFTAAEASLSHLTPASSTPTTGTVTDPTKRRILYTGIAPGSTQLPSSINAVTGVRPNFISEDAARAVAVAEDEQKQMERRRMRRGLRWGRPRAASNRRQKQRREQQHRRQK
mmetsp:Transcript_17180/g.31136  ORF Transcript_17180/g.31136 Transcript_17180/m.31136 type:complete len:335 (-) Transcript_17180:7-1011(-)